MLKVKYEFDGENPNEALEDVIIDELKELGFEPCGDDFEDRDVPTPLRVLEFESGEDDMNAHEQGFIGSEAQTTLEEIVGLATVLQFEFEPWDEDEQAEAAPAPTPPSSDKKLKYMGWCHGTDGDGKKHDKIWGVISAQREWITFWGARNKKLTFKKADDYAGAAWDSNALEKLIRSKQRKGYNETSMDEMNRLDPNFETRFEEELILCMMANNFHHG